MSYPYTRYLAAKRSVDDRALNRHVLAAVVPLMSGSAAPRILEIGAGLGTMVARLLEWRVISGGEYVLLDVDRRLLQDSRAWLREWARARGMRTAMLPDGLELGDLRVRLVEAEIGSYSREGREPVDVLLANAVLDVVEVPAVLPGLLRMLRPGGAYWFTVNFDGESIFQPDHAYDDEVLLAYHRTMDERIRYGRPAGESRTGRHLFHQLTAAGASVLSSGSSDWVVHAGPDGAYPHDEAYFLECILRTIEGALQSRVPGDHLADWIAARRDQLSGGQLLYIAHQLDFAGTWPGCPAPTSGQR